MSAIKGIVLLSGPTSGLGLELLRLLGQQDVALVVVGRKLERIGDVLAAISAPVHRIEFDLAEAQCPEKTEQLEKALFEVLGKIGLDRLVFASNAGIVEPIGQVGDVPVSGFNAPLAINLLAPVAMTNACMRYVKSVNGRLFVLNVSSGAATRPLPGWAAYCSSKAAARMYFDVLGCEAPAIVRIQHFDPGVLDTPMQAKIRAASEQQFPLVQQFSALKNEGRLKPPLEVARQMELRIMEWLQQ
ncbi:MAG: Benzil reductase ((S)-benzoin forming) [Betaproteobacteria bacterium ADurb.Bin341]|nr:MAG: Benzil reductase ((S)-benzoin forming) [Betaproteobacteria bacterium ADurb.Bin341]